MVRFSFCTHGRCPTVPRPPQAYRTCCRLALSLLHRCPCSVPRCRSQPASVTWGPSRDKRTKQWPASAATSPADAGRYPACLRAAREVVDGRPTGSSARRQAPPVLGRLTRGPAITGRRARGQTRPAAIRPATMPIGSSGTQPQSAEIAGRLARTEQQASGSDSTSRKTLAHCARDADAGGNRPGQWDAPNRATRQTGRFSMTLKRRDVLRGAAGSLAAAPLAAPAPRPRRQPKHPDLRSAGRSGDPRSDLDHRHGHPQPRLPGVRHAVRPGRDVQAVTADGRGRQLPRPTARPGRSSCGPD